MLLIQFSLHADETFDSTLLKKHSNKHSMICWYHIGYQMILVFNVSVVLDKYTLIKKRLCGKVNTTEKKEM